MVFVRLFLVGWMEAKYKFATCLTGLGNEFGTKKLGTEEER